MVYKDIWNFIAEHLNARQSVCMVVMVDAEGHGPNRPGSKLAVDSDGQRIGTVGGGASEFSLVQSAEKMINSSDSFHPKIIHMTHKNEHNTDNSGMICSGTQSFALICLTPQDLPTIRQIKSSIADNRGGILRIERFGISFTKNGNIANTKLTYQKDSWLYEEPIGKRITVTLIGGGHVSLALTPLLKSIGMRVVILDNRENLLTMETNIYADKKLVINYDNICENILPGSQSYVCIMTFGHKHDQLVLSQLAEYPLGYLGMMGSPPKIKEIKNNLIIQGIAPSALESIHAPIGLPIPSNTPEEIAISITAQLIETRASAKHASNANIRRHKK